MSGRPGGRRNGRARRAGFTLIEVLVVVVIIGLLAAAIVPAVLGRIDEAKVVRAQSDVRALDTAVKLFKKDTGRYPEQAEGLKALLEKPADVEHWQGYLEGYKDEPKDPWGRPYLYFRNEGAKPPYEITSYGADGEAGGEDEDADISSAEVSQ